MAGTGAENAGFALLKFKDAACARLGIPALEYPIPLAELDAVLAAQGEIPLEPLLAWLQDYVAAADVPWRDFRDRMAALIALLAPDTDKEPLTASGDNWSLTCGAVDLTQDVVTLVRDGELLAAGQQTRDGGLCVASYQAMDADTCAAFIRAAMPEVMVSADAPRYPWRALTQRVHRTSNAYRCEAGESYTQWWEYGVGLDADQKPDEAWFAERNRVALPAPQTLVQLGFSYAFGKTFAMG